MSCCKHPPILTANCLEIPSISSLYFYCKSQQRVFDREQKWQAKERTLGHSRYGGANKATFSQSQMSTTILIFYNISHKKITKRYFHSLAQIDYTFNNTVRIDNDHSHFVDGFHRRKPSIPLRLNIPFFSNALELLLKSALTFGGIQCLHPLP